MYFVRDTPHGRRFVRQWRNNGGFVNLLAPEWGWIRPIVADYDSQSLDLVEVKEDWRGDKSYNVPFDVLLPAMEKASWVYHEEDE